MLDEREYRLTLEQMRANRSRSEVLFKKFTEAKDFFNSHAFCFFEGEDGKYYNSRIQKYWENNFIPLVAGSKKEVLKVMQKITSDPLYTDVCVMFFVDRDYDVPLAGTHKDLFETPCYSIENLYAQECVVERILQSEFGLNAIDPDYYKCISDYRSRLLEFNEIILKFNAIIKYQHQYAPNIMCQFSSIKTSHLAHISINKVTKATRHDEQINKLITLLHIDEAALNAIEDTLRLELQPEVVFRGKNQLDFLIFIIMEFKKMNASSAYFSTKLTNVHINLSDNRLAELSQYAITPPELDIFLFNHRPQVFYQMC